MAFFFWFCFVFNKSPVPFDDSQATWGCSYTEIFCNICLVVFCCCCLIVFFLFKQLRETLSGHDEFVKEVVKPCPRTDELLTESPKTLFK